MGPCFDEMTLPDGSTRAVYEKIARWLKEEPPEHLASRRTQAELLFRRIGITFAVYGSKDAAERLIPFDIVPRVIGSAEWARLEAGLFQRVNALNMFLADIYGAQEILKSGRIPPDIILSNPFYLPMMQGLKVPHNVYVQIAGIDVVRVDANDFYVLEDNLRTPSGVSYMLENREVMMRLAPDLFAEHRVAPVENYPDILLATLRSVAPESTLGEPSIALLTPGQFNSAYYEHSFLADRLGVELVEGNDLLVRDNIVYMRTTEGPKRVDVIYRRIDDDFLDPLAFNPESVLGVPGLFAAYKAGNVTLANAVGTGIGDDKAIYSYVPDIIEFYLGEKADPEECADLALPRARGARLCARASAGTRGERGQRLRRLRHADRGRMRRRRNWRSSQKSSATIRTISSPSRRWRSQPAPPRSTAALHRAMSICGRLCSRGRMGCVWCRAASPAWR